MTKRTEVIVTLQHSLDYMATRTALAKLTGAPLQTTRKSLRGAAEATTTVTTKRPRRSDEGQNESALSELTRAPKVTERRSLAASSSSQAQLQTAFDEIQAEVRAPKVTTRKTLDREVTQLGTTNYKAVLVVRTDGTIPATFDVEEDDVYDTIPQYFRSMQALQSHLNEVRAGKSSYKVSGGILIQERDDETEDAPKVLERITINDQEDFARAVNSLTVVKIDAKLAAAAAAKLSA